jgi:hypothetical protein
MIVFAILVSYRCHRQGSFPAAQIERIPSNPARAAFRRFSGAPST